MCLEGYTSLYRMFLCCICCCWATFLFCLFDRQYSPSLDRGRYNSMVSPGTFSGSTMTLSCSARRQVMSPRYWRWQRMSIHSRCGPTNSSWRMRLSLKKPVLPSNLRSVLLHEYYITYINSTHTQHIRMDTHTHMQCQLYDFKSILSSLTAYLISYIHHFRWPTMTQRNSISLLSSTLISV